MLCLLLRLKLATDEVCKGVEANDNENIQSGYMQFCKPKIMLKKQGVALKNATPLSSGWGGWKRFCQPLKPLYFQKYFLMGGGMATLCVTLLCHTHLQLKDSIQNCT